jgi:hypothetical protein
MVTAIDIDISDLMNKPYADNGRGPDSYDCAGLFYEIAGRLGRLMPNPDTPADQNGKNRIFEAVLKNHFERIEGPRDWCAAVFRIWDEEDMEKWHIGHVLPGCTRFIHITEKTCVCTTSLNHRHWRLMLEGFYKYG